jgi:hypothetical protein
MGKPLSKASNGGQFNILGDREDVTETEVEKVPETWVLHGLMVRLESFPTGSPMSVRLNVLQH